MKKDVAAAASHSNKVDLRIDTLSSQLWAGSQVWNFGSQHLHLPMTRMDLSLRLEIGQF